MARTVKRPGMKAKVACLALIAVLILLLVYQGGRWLEQCSNNPEPRGDYGDRKTSEEVTATYNGITYRQKDGLTSVLLIGVDHESGKSGGQADFLQLIVIDSKAKTVQRLSIDRDTMTPITVLGVLGNRSGVRTAQISLSHGFGDGKEESCGLTVEAVSNLLLGEMINFYLAMNLDGITALNDFAGGVTVTLEDDFSAIDPTMNMGTTLTLMGSQAETYVRGRMSVGVGTNEARMKRQEQYVSKLFNQLDEKLTANQNAVGELYDTLSPYLVTDLSRGRLINEVWNAKDYERTELITISGEHKIGSDGFMQFYAEEDSIEQAVLALFYEKTE